MAKRKLYNIELKDRRTDPNEQLPWYSPVEAMAVSKTFIQGYVACSQSYYPSPDIRIIDYHSKEIIEEIKGNGTVQVNQGCFKKGVKER